MKPKNRETRSVVMGFLKGSKRFFAISVLAAGVTALADMLQPQIIRATVDQVLGGKPSDFPPFVNRLVERLGGFSYLAQNLWIMALAIVAVAAVQVLSQYLFRVNNTRGSETFVKTARDRLYSHIARLPYAWHMQNKTGDIIQRCTSDIETAKNFLSEHLTSVFRIVLLLTMSMIFMLSMHPLLTLIAVIPMPAIILYSIHFHNKIHSRFMDCDENEGKLSSIAQENLTGVRVVRAFGRERSQIEQFEKQNAHYTALWTHVAKLLSMFWSVSDILSGVQVMGVIIFGAWFCVKGSLTAGEFVAFASYNTMLVWPIRQLGRMISEMSKAGVSLERILYIMNSAPEEDDPDAEEAPLDGDICFENVSFGYEEGMPILRNVSFTMKAGTTLGILGGTGSGKSTMMLLLDKLYALPEGQGRITIGGKDIRKIKTAHLRRNIGMLLQEPYLFSRTIGENIGITLEEPTADQIEEAARAAALDEAIRGFAAGYETMVGERGITLSGGQKQRAAIARMLARNVPIMIFDDSLSAVDTETDAKIRRSISKRFGKASVILISHRITTLSAADQIIVLDKGTIVEQGSHSQLITAGGIYQKIYEAQSGNREVTQK